MIKDILNDIVNHTHSLGFLPLIKINGTKDATKLESLTEDRTVILKATIKNPVASFEGIFGMPNLDKLSLHVKNPEYKENALIEVYQRTNANNESFPAGLKFENETGDFKNEYRFMAESIINEKLKSVKFKGVAWDVSIEPSITAIARLKLQASANSDESTFQVHTDKNNLIFSFGDANSHAGSFVFAANITGQLKHTMSWPVNQVLSILNLDGDKTINISNESVMEITVDSGLIDYHYILPAVQK